MEWETDNKLQYGGTSVAATEMKHVSEGYGGSHYACLFVYKYGHCLERYRFVLSPATAAITKPAVLQYLRNVRPNILAI